MSPRGDKECHGWCAAVVKDNDIELPLVFVELCFFPATATAVDAHRRSMPKSIWGAEEAEEAEEIDNPIPTTTPPRHGPPRSHVMSHVNERTDRLGILSLNLDGCDWLVNVGDALRDAA